MRPALPLSKHSYIPTGHAVLNRQVYAARAGGKFGKNLKRLVVCELFDWVVDDSVFVDHVPNVVCRGAEPQVARVYAEWGVARVADPPPLRYRPLVNHEGRSVRQVGLPPVLDLPVNAVVLPCVYPTTGRGYRVPLGQSHSERLEKRQGPRPGRLVSARSGAVLGLGYVRWRSVQGEWFSAVSASKCCCSHA